MSNHEVAILKLLLSNKEKGFTIRKVAEALNINYRIAYEKVASLEKSGMLSIARVGNAKYCSFSGKFDSRVFEAEFKRREDLFSNKDFLVIRDRLAELKFQFIALLFGSHAKGTANKHSDIDILTIGGNEEEIEMTIKGIPRKMHLTCTSYENFILMAKSRDFTVGSEAIKNNIILIGIEEYYRLLENAR